MTLSVLCALLVQLEVPIWLPANSMGSLPMQTYIENHGEFLKPVNDREAALYALDVAWNRDNEDMLAAVAQLEWTLGFLPLSEETEGEVRIRLAVPEAFSWACSDALPMETVAEWLGLPNMTLEVVLYTTDTEITRMLKRNEIQAALVPTLYVSMSFDESWHTQPMVLRYVWVPLPGTTRETDRVFLRAAIESQAQPWSDSFKQLLTRWHTKMGFNRKDAAAWTDRVLADHNVWRPLGKPISDVGSRTLHWQLALSELVPLDVAIQPTRVTEDQTHE